MIIGAICELLSESQPAMSFYEDLLGERLADVKYHDLVLNTLEGAVRQREWKSLDPGLISGELLLSRYGPGNRLVPELKLPAVRRRAFARIRSASRRGDRARPVSGPGSAGRNSEVDAQMGGFDRQRETGEALRDPQPRLDFSDGTPRDEYFTVMKFEGQELGWFRKEMGREVFRLASPTGRSLGALLVPESGAFVVRSEDMSRAYDAALDRRDAQFGLDLEGFRKDVGASREVETFRRDMERGAHQDGRYHGLVYDPASGGFRAETWDKEPPKRVYGEREVLLQRDGPGDRTEKQPATRAMEERLTLSYVKERMGPVEERLERATRGFESALHEQAGLVKEYLAELKGGRAKETVDELVYDMKNARFERSAWNKAPEKGTRGEDKVLLGRFGRRATGDVRTRGDGRIV